MTQFIASIAASTLIVLIFKLFPKFEVRRFQAIVINYWVAFTLGMTLTQGADIGAVLEKDWLLPVILEGVLFIVIFNVMALTVQHHGLSIGSIASRTAFVIPAALFMILDPSEGFSWFKVGAVTLAFIAVGLCTGKVKNETLDKRFLYLPILLFLGSGLIDFIIGYSQNYLLQGDKDQALFIPCIFLIAALLGTTLAIIRFFKTEGQGFRLKEVVAGIALGLVNFLSLFFILRAIETQLLSPSIFFPVYNLGIVIAGVLLGAFVFSENLSSRKRYGILLGLISVALMIFVS